MLRVPISAPSFTSWTTNDVLSIQSTISRSTKPLSDSLQPRQHQTQVLHVCIHPYVNTLYRLELYIFCTSGFSISGFDFLLKPLPLALPLLEISR